MGKYYSSYFRSDYCVGALLPNGILRKTCEMDQFFRISLDGFSSCIVNYSFILYTGTGIRSINEEY